MLSKFASINANPRFLKKGMAVTSAFIGGEIEVVRTLTNIEKAPDFGSGYMASADGGTPCPLCKRVEGTYLTGIDAAWFKPVKAASKKKAEAVK